MKRTSRIFDHVCDCRSLEQAAHRAARANRNKGDALRFMFHLEPKILQLQRELESGAYRPGAYHTFTIHEPKERQIGAAPFRDRVVHHAVCEVLEPVFERRYIYDSYACRQDKGSHRALHRDREYAGRGGSWNNNFNNCRSANRNNNTPTNTNHNIGFRLSSSSRSQFAPVYGYARRASVVILFQTLVWTNIRDWAGLVARGAKVPPGRAAYRV